MNSIDANIPVGNGDDANARRHHHRDVVRIRETDPNGVLLESCDGDRFFRQPADIVRACRDESARGILAITEEVTTKFSDVLHRFIELHNEKLDFVTLEGFHRTIGIDFGTSGKDRDFEFDDLVCELKFEFATSIPEIDVVIMAYPSHLRPERRKPDADSGIMQVYPVRGDSVDDAGSAKTH